MKSPILALGGFFWLGLGSPVVAVDFTKDVYPILKSNCLKCHKDGKEKGDFNVQPDKLGNHIGSGLAIIPGRASSGLFMKVIQSDDPDNRMPPKGSPLSDREILVLKKWIGQGAELESAETEGPANKDSKEEVWTNAKGKELRATLLKVEGDKAILKLSNGKIFKYAISNLSKESQERVKAFAKKQ